MITRFPIHCWYFVCVLFFSKRYNGTREEDIYYYVNVIAHDSDTTCSIIWMTIYKVNIGLNNVRNRCICFRNVLSRLLITATFEISASFLHFMYFTFESISRRKYLTLRRRKKWQSSLFFTNAMSRLLFTSTLHTIVL